MTDVIAATFSDFKLIKSRDTVQLIFELPIADAKHALDVLGIPDPGKERWCGIAVLNDSAAGTQPPLPARSSADFGGAGNYPEAGSGAAGRPALTPGEKLVQQAGILSHDSRFKEWVAREIGVANGFAVDGPMFIRTHCGIASRRELAANPDAAAKFEQLIARFKLETGQSTEQRG